jgi:phage tail sheath gpL-like
MEIGTKTIEGAILQIGGLLRDYQRDIDLAFLKADEALPVSLKVTFSPNGKGVAIESEISFTMEKIKAKTGKIAIDEYQYELDLDTIHPDVRTRAHVLWMIYGDWYNDTFRAFLARGEWKRYE